MPEIKTERKVEKPQGLPNPGVESQLSRDTLRFEKNLGENGVRGLNIDTEVFLDDKGAEKEKAFLEKLKGLVLQNKFSKYPFLPNEVVEIMQLAILNKISGNETLRKIALKSINENAANLGYFDTTVETSKFVSYLNDIFSKMDEISQNEEFKKLSPEQQKNAILNTPWFTNPSEIEKGIGGLKFDPKLVQTPSNKLDIKKMAEYMAQRKPNLKNFLANSIKAHGDKVAQRQQNIGTKDDKFDDFDEEYEQGSEGSLVMKMLKKTISQYLPESMAETLISFIESFTGGMFDFKNENSESYQMFKIFVEFTNKGINGKKTDDVHFDKFEGTMTKLNQILPKKGNTAKISSQFFEKAFSEEGFKLSDGRVIKFEIPSGEKAGTSISEEGMKQAIVVGIRNFEKQKTEQGEKSIGSIIGTDKTKAKQNPKPEEEDDDDGTEDDDKKQKPAKKTTTAQVKPHAKKPAEESAPKNTKKPPTKPAEKTTEKTTENQEKMFRDKIMAELKNGVVPSSGNISFDPKTQKINIFGTEVKISNTMNLNIDEVTIDLEKGIITSKGSFGTKEDKIEVFIGELYKAIISGKYEKSIEGGIATIAMTRVDSSNIG